MTTMTKNIGLGSYVEDNEHGYKGRVTAVYLFAEFPEDQHWIDSQVPPIEEEALELMYLWYSVLVHEGGSILRPAYALDEIEAFEFENPWVDKYFPSVLSDGGHYED
jgi:hypothetical protein